MDIKNIYKRLETFAKDRNWEQFHTPKNLTMALSVEVSELLEIFQWSNSGGLDEIKDPKKRNEIERNKLLKYQGEHIIKSLLPVLDDINRTFKLKDMKKNKSIYSGIKMILEKFNVILKDIGVSPIESINEEFNPDLHEALITKKSKKKTNTIIEEFEKGYKYHDKVIRYSKVVVSK